MIKKRILIVCIHCCRVLSVFKLIECNDFFSKIKNVIAEQLTCYSSNEFLIRTVVDTFCLKFRPILNQPMVKCHTDLIVLVNI